MAKHTKQPEVLRELFEALGNDPFVIAECLARPALAERLVTSWYAYDQRIHGELKQRAEAELKARSSVEQVKQTSGKYSESGIRPRRESSKRKTMTLDIALLSVAATGTRPCKNLGQSLVTVL